MQDASRCSFAVQGLRGTAGRGCQYVPLMALMAVCNLPEFPVPNSDFIFNPNAEAAGAFHAGARRHRGPLDLPCLRQLRALIRILSHGCLGLGFRAQGLKLVFRASCIAPALAGTLWGSNHEANGLVLSPLKLG